MKRAKFLAFVAALMIAAACSEPLDEAAEVEAPQKQTTEVAATRTNEDVNMERFAEILSKAVAQNREVRAFFKSEAQQKIDNDYNVFYPISKRKAVGEVSLEQVLAKYADETELAEIQAAVPLLNIHLPELAGSTVADLDPDDEELPVLYNNVMYYDGEPIDTLAVDEVPGFNILVVTESASIRKKSGLSKSASDLVLDDEYEYVDASFKPENKSLSKVTEYENAAAMYYNDGTISRYLLDNKLYNAYCISKSNPHALRTVMYYNWTSLNDKKDQLDYGVLERIFRFKLNADNIHYYDELTRNIGEGQMFYNSTSQKKGELEREQVISNLINGRRFEFKFIVSTPDGSETSGFYDKKEFSIYAFASELFDFSVYTDKVHKTAFRHSKYTYTFNWNGTKAKWYYPDKHAGNIGSWYIEKGVCQKYISIYLADPKSGTTETKTETKQSSKTFKFDLGLDRSKVAQYLTMGIKASFGSSNTKTVTKTISYTINHSDKQLGSFTLNFFRDKVIDSSNGTIVNLTPTNLGNGFYINIVPSCY